MSSEHDDTPQAGTDPVVDDELEATDRPSSSAEPDASGQDAEPDEPADRPDTDGTEAEPTDNTDAGTKPETETTTEVAAPTADAKTAGDEAGEKAPEDETAPEDDAVAEGEPEPATADPGIDHGEPDDDEGSSLWVRDGEDAGIAYLRRSEPGWDLSKWLVAAGVGAVFILLSFILIPKVFSPSEQAQPSASSAAPSVAPSSEAPPKVSYKDAVLGSGAAHLWSFDYGADPTLDALSTSNLTLGKDVLPLGSSAVASTNGAVDCSGTARSVINSQTPETPAGDFSVEVWINTISKGGGQIVSFGSGAQGASGRTDRTLYIDGYGTVHFGVRGNTRQIVSSTTLLNDGKWHQLVGTMSTASGLTLYVDGQPVASEPKGNKVGEFEGFWRICGDSLAGWPKAGPKAQFVGTVDEVSVYPKMLSPQEVAAHFQAAAG